MCLANSGKIFPEAFFESNVCHDEVNYLFKYKVEIFYIRNLMLNTKLSNKFMEICGSWVFVLKPTTEAIRTISQN